MNLLVTLGIHAANKREHWRYDRACLIELDWQTGRVVRELSYVSPDVQRALQGHMTFTHGDRHKDRLFVPTATEIVEIDLSSWTISNVVTSPHFNDIHHALRVDDEFLVCNTGLDAVHRMTSCGKLLETWSASGTPTWNKYDVEKDYRPISTRPHVVHPNYLFFLNNEVWVTRPHCEDATRLTDHKCRISMPCGQPHDGILIGNELYFTTTNGHVVRFDHVRSQYFITNLSKSEKRNQQLGWCRGICPLADNTAIVGFSQFRRTKHKEMAHWILNDGKAALPSRLAHFDLGSGKCLREVSLTGRFEGAAIYSIFDASERN